MLDYNFSRRLKTKFWQGENFCSKNLFMYKLRLTLSCILFWVLSSSCNHQGEKNTELILAGGLPDSVASGKKLFEATCVRCHGMDGSGITGPSLTRPKLLHAPDLASFTAVVEQGIAGTGMPSNWAISDTDCIHLYSYVSYLKNQGRETPQGDALAGRKVYERANCASCHVMNGQGNSFGPDLSSIGSSRNAAYLRQAIFDPGAKLPESTDMDNGYGFSLYLPVRIITAEGKTVTGIRVNEDTYTIQVKDLANKYYSFEKDKLKSLEKEYGQSLMPSFKNSLSKDELNNLIAFLYKSGNQ